MSVSNYLLSFRLFNSVCEPPSINLTVTRTCDKSRDNSDGDGGDNRKYLESGLVSRRPAQSGIRAVKLCGRLCIGAGHRRIDLVQALVIHQFGGQAGHQGARQTGQHSGHSVQVVYAAGVVESCHFFYVWLKYTAHVKVCNDEKANAANIALK